MKLQQIVLLLGKDRFARARVKGGGHVAQNYVIRQAISKAGVPYYQKYVDEAPKKEIKDELIQYDRSLLVPGPCRCESKKFGGCPCQIPKVLPLRPAHSDGFFFHMAEINVNCICLKKIGGNIYVEQ